MQKKQWILTLVVLLPIVAAVASKKPRTVTLIQPVMATADDDDYDQPVKEEEIIRQEYTLAATGDRLLDVDNVFGSIDVVGTASNQVHVVIKKTIRGETKADVERAKKAVRLGAVRDDTSVKLYVDGPFRCHEN